MGLPQRTNPRSLELDTAPDFLAARNSLFANLKQTHDAWVTEQPRTQIEIKYQRENKPARSLIGTSWKTTPASIARQVSIRSELDRWIVARVNGQLWDIERPLEKDCVLELLDFDHPDGKKTFWESSAHILGNAAERRFGCLLNQGEARQDGFMHEWRMPESTGVGSTITKADYKPLHRLSHKIINKALLFERLEVKKEDLLEMFTYNKYKLHVINAMNDATGVVYRCGEYIDLCEGPLIHNTGKVKAFELVKNSSSYFNGDAANDSLQRIYGTSFPDKKALEDHKKWLEQAAQRDHRKIGREQELFFFHSTVSPGSAFFLPLGQVIYNTLMAYMREEYWKRGYQEVTTPNMFNSALWKTSGHWEHYSEDMFRFEVEKDEWALKPMNCPGHCVVFGHRERTYRELPLRISEFGILHRNELSGALTGLTRVRRFVQDDTHIFCMESQIEQEVKNVLDWLTMFYHRFFGFTFKVKLSTMPESHLGDLSTWQRAEAQLIKALDTLKAETGTSWELNPGDGAFYGPKIDITICDALQRDHQCASIQLDFQLPQQFNLEYRTDEQAVKADQKTPQNGIKKLPKTGNANGTVIDSARRNDTVDSLNGTISEDSIVEKDLSLLKAEEESVENDTEKINGGHDLASSPVDANTTHLEHRPEASPDLVDDRPTTTTKDNEENNNKEEKDTEKLNGGDEPTHIPASQVLDVSMAPQLEHQQAPHPDIVADHPTTTEATTKKDEGQEGQAHRRELTPGFARPVMIHRGLLGSFERFIAILCEHFAGKWPFWLSPRQIMVVPVTAVVNDYAVEVQSIFRQHNMRADVDISRSTMTKKIRTGQLHNYNFIFVLGRKERDSRSVNVRNRDDPTTHRRGDLVPVDKALEALGQLRDERQLSNLVSFI
ncbi:threonine--tRNA ligase [Paecilomyces variotii No. 5]|uniref:Probable threonine--tRNA ligase, cytoplasmic n=1 Tax=Byssochlamys spectabilis (strain No. 5 / NBRC 109023) TaxID=1356009 RepID=V5G8Y3_BYSSN|nr:threonine--tRNA ligase [Paecilomyces variotii No. 5]